MPRIATPRRLARPGAALLAGLLMNASAAAAEPVTPALTDKLDRLLRDEMQSIQTAMGRIHTAMVMGHHDAVAEDAQGIHNSFILRQSLTEQDRQDLMAAVPDAFVQLDRRFHVQAAALAKAGREHDSSAQLRAYNRMTEACLACHARYVSDRFPGVSEP